LVGFEREKAALAARPARDVVILVRAERDPDAELDGSVQAVARAVGYPLLPAAYLIVTAPLLFYLLFETPGFT
jgi:hypothetical protein